MRADVGSHTGDRHRVGPAVEHTSRGHLVVFNRIGDRAIRGIKGTEIVRRKCVNALAAHVGIIEDIQCVLLSVDPDPEPHG